MKYDKCLRESVTSSSGHEKRKQKKLKKDNDQFIKDETN